MRRAKFVELASAYLDGELSAEEQALLRQELAANPKYRALFASYVRMNKAAARADFPEVDLEPASGYRHSFAVSTVSWCVAGAFASVMSAFTFVAFSGNRQPALEQYAAMDLPRQVVVTNDVKLVAKPVNSVPPPVVAQRTPIQSLAASSDFKPRAGDQFRNTYAANAAEDPLARLNTIPTAPYSFAKAASVTQPGQSIVTPVSFVSMSDH